MRRTALTVRPKTPKSLSGIIDTSLPPSIVPFREPFYTLRGLKARYISWIYNKFRKWNCVFKAKWRLRKLDGYKLKQFLSVTVPELYEQFKVAFMKRDMTALRRVTTDNAFYTIKNEAKVHEKKNKYKVEVKDTKLIHGAMFKESRLRIEFAQFTVEVKANLQSFNNPNDVKEIVEYVVFERNLLDPHQSFRIAGIIDKTKDYKPLSQTALLGVVKSG